jgi:serine/threonine-protein kinase
MAEVFRGVAESLQGFRKNVAIKRILPSLTKNKKFVSMFLDEAKLSLYLQHANIVQVFDIGVVDNSYFLVMEYIDGCNLKQIIEPLAKSGRRMNVAHAIYIVLECCKALNYAHHLESPDTNEPLHIVHRDISPPNILISKMGEVKLVDFGLAKASSQIQETDPGVVKGKFSYLSPEAASGKVVDHRADIFAIGILLWEMFTGRRLFYGDTDYQTVELVRQCKIPSIVALNPEIEPELEAIVRKALARDPEQRFQEAHDVGDALAQYLFSRRMKVTARDIAHLVAELAESRRAPTRSVDSSNLIDQLIKDEMGRITSLVPEPTTGEGSHGTANLDPATLIDTSGWAQDFGLSADTPNSIPAFAGGSPRPEAAPRRAAGTESDFDAMPPVPADEDTPAEIESLSDILTTTGMATARRQQRTSNLVLTLMIVAVLLMGALGTALFVFRDRLF